MAIASNFPAIKPSLLLDFANTKKLDSRITFTRTTTATYYDGVTTAKAEENLLTRSQELNLWTPTNATVGTDTDVAPDGTTTAEAVKESSATGVHRIQQPATTALAGSTVYTLSVFVKQKTGSRYATIGISSDSSNFASATFDLSSGTNTQTLTNSYTSASATITASVSSWYRITLTATTNASGSTSALMFLGLSATSTFGISSRGFDSYTGDDTSEILYWGAQLEQRSSVTSYTATTTQPITNYIPVLLTAASGVARFDHNPTTDESLGLLIEEQRTNLLTYSADFSNAAWTGTTTTSVTANAITSPDGTVNADKIIPDTDVEAHFRQQTYAGFTASTVYTLSAYAKAGEWSTLQIYPASAAFSGLPYANFQLTTGIATAGNGGTASMVAVGNGWYRCTLTATASTTASANCVYAVYNTANPARAATVAGDGYSGIYIWGAQLEAGAFATSYIATTSATVTRNADAASMTGTNFSSWYSAGQGTLYADINPMALAASNGVVINDNTTSNRIRLATTSVSDQGTVTVSGTAQATLDGGTPVANTNMKLAMTYQVNNFALSLNGATAVTDTSGTVPVVSQLQIGSETTTVGNLQIKKIAYYPIASTATQLQDLTS